MPPPSPSGYRNVCWSHWRGRANYPAWTPPWGEFQEAKGKSPFNWRVLGAVGSQEIPTWIDMGHEKLTGPSYLRALLRFQKAPRTLGSAEC